MNHQTFDNVHPPCASVFISLLLHSDITHSVVAALLSWAAVRLVSHLVGKISKKP